MESRTPASRNEWLDLRQSTVGASEIAALLGVHPWMTPFKLFAIKTGQYKEEREKTKILKNSIHMPPMVRGNFMEEKAFEAMQMLRPAWAVKRNQIPSGQIYIDREAGISATPDAFIDKGDCSGMGALQIKTVAPMEFDKHWKNEDGAVEFPIHVAVQAIADATLSGCEWACAGALVNNFGVHFYLIDVPLTAGLMNKAREKATDFWRRVRANDPYPPHYARDGEVIRSLYQDDDGGTIDLSGNERAREIVSERGRLKQIERTGADAAAERFKIDDELRYMLGNAVRGTLADGRVIEAKTIRKKGFVVEPTTFRSIKIKQPAHAAYCEAAATNFRDFSRSK